RCSSDGNSATSAKAMIAAAAAVARTLATTMIHFMAEAYRRRLSRCPAGDVGGPGGERWVVMSLEPSHREDRKGAAGRPGGRGPSPGESVVGGPRVAEQRVLGVGLETVLFGHAEGDVLDVDVAHLGRGGRRLGRAVPAQEHDRSEERRVGKEGGTRGRAEHDNS